jgi:ATP adenylyltransferase
VGDAWERLYTPHRMVYLRGEGKPAHDDAGADCPFCRAPDETADDGLVVARGDEVYAVLNLYPYNAGHLMVCPYRHVGDYTDLTVSEVAELGAFTQKAMRVLRTVSSAQGFNIGMNQGSIAGAGIAGHLHQHVIPRWGGDTNFMPIVGGTKVIPQLLEDTRALLAEEWEK